MAKKSNQRTVVFLSDFANRKAGEEFSCDGMLARDLVDEGVAKFKGEVKEADSTPFTLEVEQPEEVVTEEAPIESTEQEAETHTITEEDLTNNPELVGQVEIGEVVELGPTVPAEDVFEPLPEVTAENSGKEKVSKPAKKDKKSSSKPKGN